MTKPEYIRINEAVKVYDKTRQTFYNYVNREQIDTKKINNKLFLSVQDIEKVLSEYADTSDKVVSSRRQPIEKNIPEVADQPQRETISTTITPPFYSQNPKDTISHEQMNDMLTRMDIIEDLLHDTDEHIQSLSQQVISVPLGQIDQLKESLFHIQESIGRDSTSYYQNISQLIQLSFRHLHTTLIEQQQETIHSIDTVTQDISLKKLRFRIYYLVFVLSNICIIFRIYLL